MTSSEVEWLQVKLNDFKWSWMTSSEVEWLQMKFKDFYWSLMTSSDVEWLKNKVDDFNEVKLFQIVKLLQVKSSKNDFV